MRSRKRSLAAFPDHFSAGAENYRQARPSYPMELVAWLGAISEDHSTAWDAGCGSGQMSVPLATWFKRVVASDASSAQIAAAPENPRVCYRVARSEASAIPSAAIDLAVAAQAAHWFDLFAYYDEVQRVGKEHCKLALICYGRPVLEGALGELTHRFHAEALQSYWPDQRRHVEELYRSLPFPFKEETAPEFTMNHVWDLANFWSYVQSWSAVRILQERGGSASLRQFRAAIEDAWGDPASLHEIQWPIGLRVGQV